jgi:hypothetical protein
MRKRDMRELSTVAETAIPERPTEPPPTPPPPSGKPLTADVMLERRDSAGNLTDFHPKLRGWFYPTRYNEIPGRYEDENGHEWYYRLDPGKPSWALANDLDGWFHVPLTLSEDERPGNPIAVRWIGELE